MMTPWMMSFTLTFTRQSLRIILTVAWSRIHGQWSSTEKETLPQTIGKRSYFAREDLTNIFNPVIDDILKLIDEQVESIKVKLGGRGPKVWYHACYKVRKQ